MDDIGVVYTTKLVRLMDWNEKDLGLDRDTFCSYLPCAKLDRPKYFDPDFDVNMAFKPDDKAKAATRAARLSTFGLCYAASAAGFAASALSVRDLEQWPALELYECLEVIGGIDWPTKPTNVKSQVWSLLKKTLGDRILTKDGRLEVGAMILLMPMLDVIAKNDFEMTRADGSMMIEPFSWLGTQPLEKSLVAKLANKYSEERQLLAVNGTEDAMMTKRTKLEIASLGNLVCGLPVGVVDKVVCSDDDHQSGNHSSSSSSADDLTLKLLGSTVTNCRNQKVLNLLAKKTALFQKQGQDWSDADVANLSKYGVIAAGSPPSKMSKWPPTAFRSFTPDVLSHLTVGHLAALSPDQLAAVPSDAWSVVNVTQLMNKNSMYFRPDQRAAIKSKAEFGGGITILPLGRISPVPAVVSTSGNDDFKSRMDTVAPESDPDQPDPDQPGPTTAGSAAPPVFYQGYFRMTGYIIFTAFYVLLLVLLFL